MRQLTKDLPEVNLALSLHAPNQPMREAIVPTAKMYPIQDMVDALDEHMTALLHHVKLMEDTVSLSNATRSIPTRTRKSNQ